MIVKKIDMFCLVLISKHDLRFGGANVTKKLRFVDSLIYPFVAVSPTSMLRNGGEEATHEGERLLWQLRKTRGWPGGGCRRWRPYSAS